METIALLRKQMETFRTDTHLMEAILNVINRALVGRPISVTGPFERVLRAQEQIGWRSLLHGHWAKEWQISYQTSYATPADESIADKSKRHIHMRRWQTQLIRTMWTSMIAMWKIRNDDRHGRDKETREEALHEVLKNEIHKLYAHRDQYPIGVRNLLQPTFADYSGDTASQLEDWLHAHRVTFKVTHNRLDG